MAADFMQLTLAGGGVLAGLGLPLLIRTMAGRRPTVAAAVPDPTDDAAQAAIFRGLAEAVPVGIFTTDAVGACVFVNPKYCEITGQCMKSAPGRATCTFANASCSAATQWSAHDGGQYDWRVFVHPDDLELVDEKWAQLLADCSPFVLQYRMRRLDGAIIWVEAQAQRQLQSGFEQGMYVCTLMDITAHKAAEYEIQQLAFIDTLTGLPNRRLLMERIKQAIAGSVRTGHHSALLYLDLDNFKLVNDTRGHAVGDMLLQQVANRLKASIREGDTVARLGGDEFLVVLETLGKSPRDAGIQAETVANKILANLNKSYLLAGVEHHNSPSIGLTLIGIDRVGADELMKCADMAMYQSKAAGRNTVRFYDPAMQALVEARVALEGELRHAVTTEAFELHYQPQLDSHDAITGVEAFVRWQTKDLGWVSPAAFIPLAEETGLIIPLGNWVLRTACRQLAAWSGNHLTAQLSLSVKVSAQQFRQADFVEQVMAIVHQSHAPANFLKLDLNESLLLADIEDIVNKTTALTAHGIGCTLADLGTGYSSLSHLKRLSLEQLRIDQSFVQGLLTKPNDAAVTRSILALAQSMDIKVSAEGIETQEQHAALKAFGCQAFQGYLFGQPMPVDQFEKALGVHRAAIANGV